MSGSYVLGPQPFIQVQGMRFGRDGPNPGSTLRLNENGNGNRNRRCTRSNESNEKDQGGSGSIRVL